MAKEVIERICRVAERDAKDLEPWPGYFIAKKSETLLFLDYFQQAIGKTGLEIGCGNGFQSCLLAQFSKRIVATDMPWESTASHSIGICKARKLVGLLNLSNVDVVSCSGTSLPFSSGYFDFVYSSSALEHIKDRQAVIREIHRVLKPDGTLFLTVPTHVLGVFSFPSLYIYLIKRSAEVIFDSIKEMLRPSRNKGPGAGYKNSRTRGAYLKRFCANHPSFPLPEPHGDYSTVFEEMRSMFPKAWLDLLNKNKFSVKSWHGILFMPWNLIEAVSPYCAATCYRALVKVFQKMRFINFFNYFSYLILIVSQKRRADAE